jgi:hypothetical protein
VPGIHETPQEIGDVGHPGFRRMDRFFRVRRRDRFTRVRRWDGFTWVQCWVYVLFPMSRDVTQTPRDSRKKPGFHWGLRPGQRLTEFTGFSVFGSRGSLVVGQLLRRLVCRMGLVLVLPGPLLVRRLRGRALFRLALGRA